ncbi:hypothetical protein A3718_06075 [Erythrobacter sp. HI0019]|nr:ATP-binding protein [Erythrobacter sp. HI0019]KZX94996.1 hypothetical protein A3718_06075 [Erythrobacter sp. HI0019]
MSMDLQSGLLGFALGAVAVVLLALWRTARSSNRGKTEAVAGLPGKTAPVAPTIEEVVEGLPDMIVAIGADRVRRYVSPSCKWLLGFTPEEMIGLSPINAIHPDDRALTMEASEKLFNGEVSSTLTTYRHKHADGHYVWLEAHMTTRWHDDGEIRDFVGVVRDIGGRRRQKLRDSERNAQLRENNRLLQMAEESANIGHWRVDVQEGTLFWSDQVYRIHGVDKDFVPDVASGLDFYCEEDRARVSEMVDKAFSEGANFEFQARIVRPDGELRHVASLGNAETAPTGEVVTVFGIFKDITETVEAEEQLRQSRDIAERASQAKAHFLANMSHEIRTPMNGVIGFADLLLESELEKEHHDYARMISDSGKAMLRLLNELLDLSKIEAGRMQLTREPVNFGHIVRSSARLFEPNAKAKGIRLDIDVPPDMPEGIGDKLRIRQIVLNLVGNAIKFTERGSVRVEACEKDGKIVFRVIDTGIGVPPDQLAYIFEEFAQLDNFGKGKASASGGGTGLGLAIARQLAELMDGRLTAESTPGKGSTFELVLPLVKCPAQKSATKQDNSASSYRTALAGRRVLLAEDAEINQKLIVAMLSRLGVETQVADDGQQAVQQVMEAKAQGRPFDAVLMDMQMPVMDGLDASRALRANGVGPRELPIIAVTANAYADDIELCMEAGMQDHVAKPISAERLGPCLEQWLTKPAPGSGELAETDLSVDVDDARNMYEQRKLELRNQLAALEGEDMLGSAQCDLLRDKLHVMAGIAKYFGDEELGQLAGRIERDLKLAADDANIGRALDELRHWFDT